MQKCYCAILIVAIKSSNRNEQHGVGSVTWEAGHGNHLGLLPLLSLLFISTSSEVTRVNEGVQPPV